jgi:hypothetical protein
MRSCYRRSGKYNSARHSYISNNKGAGYGCSTYARNVFSLRLLIFLFNKGNQYIVVKSFFLYLVFHLFRGSSLAGTGASPGCDDRVLFLYNLNLLFSLF